MRPQPLHQKDVYGLFHYIKHKKNYSGMIRESSAMYVRRDVDPALVIVLLAILLIAERSEQTH
jgi:hypothetical protein